MLSIFACPLRYTQGENATLRLGQELATLGLGGSAAIIAGPSAVRELSGTWERSLSEAGIVYRVHAFGGECSVAEIERARDEARAASARVLIGAGGGKALDTARAAASELDLPFVSCPTIASTDAPCSAIAIVYSESGVFQEVRNFGRNPDLVLVDTSVIVRSPPRLQVAGMGDALSTYFEARTCVEGHRMNCRGGLSTLAAMSIAELCYRTLLADGLTALQSNRARVVTPAFERVVEANTLLSGLGFESSGLAAAHSVHNGLTAAPATHDYYHGEKVAFGVLTQLVLEGRPRAEIDQVLALSTSVGLPVTLAQVGLRDLPPALLAEIAARAAAPGEVIHNEPFEVTPSRVASAILAADAIGRAYLGEAGQASSEMTR